MCFGEHAIEDLLTGTGKITMKYNMLLGEGVGDPMRARNLRIWLSSGSPRVPQVKWNSPETRFRQFSFVLSDTRILRSLVRYIPIRIAVSTEPCCQTCRSPS